MARKVEVKKTLSRKQRLVSQYRKASAERRRLVNYLKAADGVLSEAEKALLREFAQLAKRKCDRLRRAIEQQSATHAA
jgi:hypothetical protein